MCLNTRIMPPFCPCHFRRRAIIRYREASMTDREQRTRSRTTTQKLASRPGAVSSTVQQRLKPRSNYMRASLRNRAPAFPERPMQSAPPAPGLASPGRRGSPALRWRLSSCDRTSSMRAWDDVRRGRRAAGFGDDSTLRCLRPDMASSTSA